MAPRTKRKKDHPKMPGGVQEGKRSSYAKNRDSGVRLT